MDESKEAVISTLGPGRSVSQDEAFEAEIFENKVELRASRVKPGMSGNNGKEDVRLTSRRTSLYSLENKVSDDTGSSPEGTPRSSRSSWSSAQESESFDHTDQRHNRTLREKLKMARQELREMQNENSERQRNKLKSKFGPRAASASQTSKQDDTHSKQQIKLLKKERSYLTAKLGVAENRLAGKDDQVERLQSSQSKLKIELKSLRQDLEKQRLQNVQLHEAKARETGHLASQLEASRKELSVIQLQHSSLQEEVERTRFDARHNKERLEATIDGIRLTLKQRDFEVGNLKANTLHLEQELQSAKDTIRTQNEEISSHGCSEARSIGEIQRLQDDALVKEAEIERLTKNIDRLRQETQVNVDLIQRNNFLSQQNNQLKDKLSSASDKLVSSLAQLEVVTREKENLTSQYNSIEAAWQSDRENFNKDMEVANVDSLVLKDQILQARKELESYKSDTLRKKHHQVKLSQERCTQLESQLEQAKESASKKEASIARMQEDKANQNRKLKECIHIINEREKELHEAKKAAVLHRKTIKKLEGNVANLSEQVAKGKEGNLDIQKELEEKQIEFGKTQTSLEDDIEKLRHELRVKTDTVDSLQQGIQEMRASQNELSTALNDKINEIGRLQCTLDETKTELERQRLQINEKTTLLDQAQARLKDSTSTLHDTRDQLELVNKDFSKLQRQHANTIKENNNLSGVIVEKTHEHGVLTTKLKQLSDEQLLSSRKLSSQETKILELTAYGTRIEAELLETQQKLEEALTQGALLNEKLKAAENDMAQNRQMYELRLKESNQKARDTIEMFVESKAIDIQNQVEAKYQEPLKQSERQLSKMQNTIEAQENSINNLQSKVQETLEEKQQATESLRKLNLYLVYMKFAHTWQHSQEREKMLQVGKVFKDLLLRYFHAEKCKKRATTMLTYSMYTFGYHLERNKEDEEEQVEDIFWDSEDDFLSVQSGSSACAEETDINICDQCTIQQRVAQEMKFRTERLQRDILVEQGRQDRLCKKLREETKRSNKLLDQSSAQEHELLALKAELASEQNKNNNMTTLLASKEDDLKHAALELKKKENEISGFRKGASVTAETITFLERQLQNLSKELELVQEDVVKAVDALQQSNTHASSKAVELHTAQTQNDNLLQENTSLLRVVEELKSKVTGLQESSGLEKTQLLENMRDLRHNLDEMEKEKTSMLETIGKLRITKQSMEARLDQLSAELVEASRYREQVHSLEYKVLQLKSEVDKQRSDLNKAALQEQRHNLELASSEKRATELRKQYQGQRCALEKEKLATSALKNHLENLKSQLQSEEGVTRILRTEKASMEEEIAKVQLDLSRARESGQRLQSDLETELARSSELAKCLEVKTNTLREAKVVNRKQSTIISSLEETHKQTLAEAQEGKIVQRERDKLFNETTALRKAIDNLRIGCRVVTVKQLSTHKALVTTTARYKEIFDELARCHDIETRYTKLEEYTNGLKHSVESLNKRLMALNEENGSLKELCKLSMFRVVCLYKAHEFAKRTTEENNSLQATICSLNREIDDLGHIQQALIESQKENTVLKDHNEHITKQQKVDQEVAREALLDVMDATKLIEENRTKLLCDQASVKRQQEQLDCEIKRYDAKQLELNQTNEMLERAKIELRARTTQLQRGEAQLRKATIQLELQQSSMKNHVTTVGEVQSLTAQLRIKESALQVLQKEYEQLRNKKQPLSTPQMESEMNALQEEKMLLVQILKASQEELYQAHALASDL